MLQLSRQEKKRLRKQLLETMMYRLPPLIEIPVPETVRAESWFRESGIGNILKKYGFPGFHMKAINGKAPSALKAWLMDEEAGAFENRPTVIGATSGNWGMSTGLIAPLFEVEDFYAVIDRSVPAGKQHHLHASGAKILFPPNGAPAIDFAHELATKDSSFHLIDQYTHEGSILGHQWTMDHIARELARMDVVPSLFGAVTGTCSTVMAAHRFLRGHFPDMKVFGVASMSQEEKVPGSRSPEGLAALEKIGGFPYKEALNFPLVTSVPRCKAYALNAAFVQRHFISMGPTGALLEAGSYHLLKHHWETYGDFKDLMNPQGMIVVTTFFMDMHLAYLDDPEFRTAFGSL